VPVVPQLASKSAQRRTNVRIIVVPDIINYHIPFHHLGAAMTDKKSLTGIEQDIQIEERTKHAMENYSQWLQNAMSASPWGNSELNKKLLSYATENVTTAVGLVQKLSQAKNLEEVVKIQTEFISKQMVSFNQQTKTIVEICTTAAQDMTKRSA
jgi:hypothetical protein